MAKSSQQKRTPVPANVKKVQGGYKASMTREKSGTEKLDPGHPGGDREKVVESPATNLPVVINNRAAHLSKADPFYLQKRRKIAAELYLKGYTQWEMAVYLDVDQSTIVTDLEEVRQHWIKEMVRDYDERKAYELARIDLIETEMWKAWHRSTEDEEVYMTSVEKELRTKFEGTGKERRVVSEEMTPVKTSARRTKRGMTGNAAYMDRIAWCIEMRCKLFGFMKDLDKSTKVNVININWEMLASVGSGADEINKIIAGAEDPIKLEEHES